MSNGWREGLPPHARDVLRSAEEDQPSTAKMDRLRSALAVSLAAGVATTGTVALASGAASAAATSGTSGASATGVLALVGKWLGMGIVVAAATTAAVEWVPSEAVDEGADVFVAPSAVPWTSEGRSPRYAAALPSEPVVETTASEVEIVSIAERARTSPATGRGMPPTPSATVVPIPSPTERPDEASNSSLSVELDLLTRIRRNAQTDPALALRLTDEHARRFGDSTFSSERDFFRINALVSLGRHTAARHAADGFVSRHPHSPYEARVQALVGSLEP